MECVGCYFLMKQLPQEPDHEKGTKKRFGFQFPFKKHPRFQTTQLPPSDAPKLFRLKLDTIMSPPAYNIPQVLCGILLTLYLDGPSTFGIFRIEASNRQVNELIKRIENGEEIDFEEYRVVVVANVFKRFLRAIPGCLLLSSKYTEFAATNDIKSDPERVERIKKILAKMPASNCVLAHYVFVILREITENVKHNQMCALNLGKCLGPSILQPMEGLKVYQLEMHEVVAFIIDHCYEVFGEQIPELYRNTQANKQKVLVPVKSESPRKQLLSSRGDSNDSMDSELNRTGESCESDALPTPTNEPPMPLSGNMYRRESHDSLRSRFRSEPNMQRSDHSRSIENKLKKNISIEVTEITPFDSPGTQSRSTPNSPELVRSTGHLDAPPRESQSRSTPNTPEVVRATQNKRLPLEESSDEDEKPTQSKARVFIPTSDYTAPQYYKHRLGANQNPPSYPQQIPMTSPTYQTPSYYKHANNTGGYPRQPFNEYGMQRLTHTTGTYPHTLPSDRNFENNVRDKPRSGQLTRSSASYELSYPRTLPHPHPQAANQIHSSEAHHMRVRPDSVLPLSIQKSRAVIATFPIIQDAQISKLSEVRPFVDVSHV